jgi:ferredoxin-type protein NapH
MNAQNLTQKAVKKPPRFRLPFWTWTHRAVQSIFLLALVWSASDVAFWYIRGSTGATRVFDWFSLADPLAALEMTLARKTIEPNLWIAAGLILILYVLAGRAYCAWACPLGLVLDLNNHLRSWVGRKLRRRRIKLPELSLSKNIKYWVLGVTLALSLITSVPVFLLVSPINILARALIYGGTAAVWFVIIILALEWIAPRVWCKSVCPLGAFYSLVGRFGVFRVTIDQEKEKQGKQCKLCAYNCPMGIDIVGEQVNKGYSSIIDGECTRCGVCTDVCVRSSLRLGFKWPWSK